MIEIELRLPVWPARLALAALLVCVLGRRSISDDFIVGNSYSGSPSGAYSGAAISGVDQTGAPVDSYLAYGAGSVMRIASAAGGPARLYSSSPLWAIGSGAAVGPAAPPNGPGGTPAILNTRGANSGVGLQVEGTVSPANPVGNAFRIYPYSGNLAVNFNDNGDASPIYQFSNGGLASFCVLRTTTFGTTTSCGSGFMVLGSGAAPSAAASGQIVCCRLALKCTTLGACDP